MKKENIKEIVKQLNNYDYKELFASIVIFEQISHIQDVEDITDDDIEFLEDLYYNFLHSEITGLINTDIKELIEELQN